MVRSGKNGGLHLKQIAYYKRTGEYHPTTLSSERSGIRRAAKKFVFKGKKILSNYSENSFLGEGLLIQKKRKDYALRYIVIVIYILYETNTLLNPC